MLNFLRSLISRVVWLIVLGIASSASAETPAIYGFSPVNQYGIQLTASYWNPILAYISDKSGVRLNLKIGRTSADTTAYVLAHEVDFVFSNHMFSPEREKLGWKVFARRNSPLVTGQIIVPADSPISSLEQLAGKRIVYAGPEALIGYKLPQAELIRRGITVEVVFAGNHDAALVQLFAGKAQAAGGNDQLIAGWAKREQMRHRVLWKSDPVQDLALMASANVPSDVVERVRAAFIGMSSDPNGLPILASSSRAVGMLFPADFVASDGREYIVERSFYQSAPAALR